MDVESGEYGLACSEDLKLKNLICTNEYTNILTNLLKANLSFCKYFLGENVPNNSNTKLNKMMKTKIL